MKTHLCGAVLALGCLCQMVAAQGVRDIYLLHSASELRSYGVLMTLPADAPCAAARIVVLDAQDRLLGQSGLLVPGEQGRVRLGQGFAVGVHELRLHVSGCAARAVLVRRITLNKASPDHGWRGFVLSVSGV